MRSVAVIGSTGSVGRQALDVIARHPDRFRVAALTAHANIDLLREQALRFSPAVVGVSDKGRYAQAKEALAGFEVVCGEDAHALALEASRADASLVAVVGFAGLSPLVKSIERGLHTCVANKESIVCGGEAIAALLNQKGVRIYPVDSEHSAIFQCLDGHRTEDVSRILLTCSGGALRNMTREELARAKAAQALKHPNWDMGAKITIDSATLCNKGLEVLEARWLFGVALERIEVVIHPQSIIHSMVEWADGSIIAQLGAPDMRLPIQVALGYPQRLPMEGRPLDVTRLGPLTFDAPDLERFPCLQLAYEAGRRGGAAPIALNAANEMAVAAYLRDRIGFYDIPRWIEQALTAFDDRQTPALDDIPRVDAAVRQMFADRLRA